MRAVHLPALFVPLWIAAFPSVAFATQDAAIEAQLARLSSPSAAERSAAERHLAAHLRAEDGPALAAALTAGTPEVRGRIVEALAGEDRHLGLSAGLAASTGPPVRTAGRTALVESVLRWCPEAHADGADPAAVAGALRARRTLPASADPLLAAAPLEDLLDLLLRQAPAGCAVAVDPRVESAGRVEAAAAIEGPFDAVLLELCERRGLAPRGFGLTADAPPGSVPWILLVPREGEGAAGTGAVDALPSVAQRIADWCVVLERGGDSPARFAAARALASCGWPAAVAWLAERWIARDDAAALDGVLLAARRGRVAAQLLDPGTQARLRAEVERALASGSDGGVRAIRIALALGATGSRGAAGEDLLAPALQDLRRLSGRALHARLVEIAERRPAADLVRPALDLVLARTDVALPTLWIALELRAGASAPPGELPRAADLVEWAASQGRLPDLARCLRGDRAFPQESWRDPAALPAAWTAAMRVLVAGAWLERLEVEAAAAHVAFALRSADPAAREELGSALGAAALQVDLPLATRWFTRLLASADADPADLLRLVAEAGGARTDVLADRVLAATGAPPVTRADLLALGALAAGPRGEAVRERLLAAVRGTAASDDVVAGLGRAISELRAARDETIERAFTKAVREEAARAPLQLRSRLRVDSWPIPSVPARVRLADFDRSFARAGI